MGTPRYKSLVDELAKKIRAGKLAPGTRLPTHRELAATHGMALATATKVYTELIAMGLISGETGRGTFVRDLATPPGDGQTLIPLRPGMTDLGFNYPSSPNHAGILRDALRNFAGAGDTGALMLAQPTAGRERERRLVARYLHGKGVAAAPAQLLLLGGAQQGLTLTVMSLLRAGDVVAADELSYPGFIALAKVHGLELLPIPWTRAGPDLDALAKLMRERPVKAIFCMPTLQNPTGWVMPMAERNKLVALAEKHDAWIIEDGTYAFLVAQAPAPVHALAPERTIYVSGFSKSVGGGVRFGFVVAPVALYAIFEKTLRALLWSSSTLIAALAGNWLEDGTVLKLEAEKRAEARRRHQVAVKALEGLDLMGHPSSYFVWIRLPEDVRADRLAAALAEKNILVATAESFAVSHVYPHAIRLSLAAESLERIKSALGVVREEIELQSCL